MRYETIIIGAGIGGLSAGIYAARKKMNYLLLSNDVGGQMYGSGEILNYPGITETTGVEFAATFEKQIAFNDLHITTEAVQSVQRKAGGWEVTTDKASYETDTVLVASGSVPRKLGVPGEEELAKKGVTYCAVCDGPLFGGKDVAIVGSGNSALEAADFMSRIAKKIYLVTTKPAMKGHEYLIERVTALENVEVIANAATKKVLGEEFVTGLSYEQDSAEKKLDVQAVIIEIGRIPNTGLVGEAVDLDEHKHIKVDRWARCYHDGVLDETIYAIGDCTDVHEYQYVISAGMGVTALLKAARYLANRKS